MNYLSREEKLALWHLARRVNKVRTESVHGKPWVDYMHINKDGDILCFICDKNVPFSTEALSIHGRQHLKEHNLLVFI